MFRLSFTSVLYFQLSRVRSPAFLPDPGCLSTGELPDARSVGEGLVVFSEEDVLADWPDSSLLPFRIFESFFLGFCSPFSTVRPFVELDLLIFPWTSPPKPPMFFFSLIPNVLLKLPNLFATESARVLSLSFLCLSFSLFDLPLLMLELLQTDSRSESMDSAKDCTSSPAEAVGDSGWAKGACKTHHRGS